MALAFIDKCYASILSTFGVCMVGHGRHLKLSHYEILLCNIQSLKINNVIEEKDIFSIFAQILDCGYTLEPPLMTSAHNLCFGTTIRKIGLPIKNPDLLYKSSVYGDTHCTDMFS